MQYFLIGLYVVALSYIFFFSLGQLHLTWLYLKTKKKFGNSSPTPMLGHFPKVTVQLPVYNEKYVIERLIDCVCALDYPKDKLEIQVLDDSTDDAKELAAEKIKYYQSQGIDIQHVLRPERKGFKAGALAYGLNICKGEYIAIFDADFLPQSDFLLQTIPYFNDEKIGVVQTRWGHINKEYSLLTRLLAFGLDAHFTIEQGGRSEAGSFINFNGTGGVWRKSCIIDAGGWSDDTLTEDLDLSYRAQMKGWRFHFREEVVAPAELPVIMPAIKSQQYRWNKGAAETARKHLAQVLRSKKSFANKAHAFFHLFNSSVFLSLLIASVLSVPVLIWKQEMPQLAWIFHLGLVFVIGFFSIGFFYWVAGKSLDPSLRLLPFGKQLLLFLTVSMGLSLHNAIAVLEGLMGRKTPFIRTPKFNITQVKDSWKGNVYLARKIAPAVFVEFLLSLYFFGALLLAWHYRDFSLSIFHLMLGIGFGTIAFYSFKSAYHVEG